MAGSERKSWEGPRKSVGGRSRMSVPQQGWSLFPGPLGPWEDRGGGQGGLFPCSSLKPQHLTQDRHVIDNKC